jgi:hypothetical protein
MNELRWDEYRTARVDPAHYAACRQAHDSAFLAQRRWIGDLVTRHRPRRIVCLGAGFLNDIPIEILLAHDRQTVLVDWIEGVPREGLNGRIISDDGGAPACLFCRQPDPGRYCSHYAGCAPETAETCRAFSLIADPVTSCVNYAPGADPLFLTHDVTAGVATTFAEQALPIVRHSRSVRDAFSKAIDACRHPAREGRRLPIEDDAADIVTSSMLVSQFDNEPYRYFSLLLEHWFGRDEILRQEETVRPLMETLRSTLFQRQMAGHADELYRLVDKRRGRVFFAVELFQNIPESETYFLVQEIPRALDELRRRFFFEFSLIPPSRTLSAASIGDGPSLVQNYVLVPKPAVDPY